MSLIVEAGEVVHIAKSGRLILKIGNGILLKTGESLFDETGKKVGKVTELIGPVEAPYASVLLEKAQIKRITGHKLFRNTIHRGVSTKSKKKSRSFRNRKRKFS